MYIFAVHILTAFLWYAVILDSMVLAVPAYLFFVKHLEHNRLLQHYPIPAESLLKPQAKDFEYGELFPGHSVLSESQPLLHHFQSTETIW